MSKFTEDKLEQAIIFLLEEQVGAATANVLGSACYSGVGKNKMCKGIF